MNFVKAITLCLTLSLAASLAFAQQRRNFNNHQQDEPTGPSPSDPNTSGALNQRNFQSGNFFQQGNSPFQSRIIQSGYSNLPISIHSPADSSDAIRYQLIEASGVAYDYTINPGKTQNFKDNSNWKLRMDRGNGQGEIVYQLNGNGEYQFTQQANGSLGLINKTSGVGQGHVMLGFNGTMHPSGGMYVHNVNPGSIAEKIGLKVGDVVLTIDGRSFSSRDEYLQLLQNVGTQFHVQIRDIQTGRIIQHDLDRP
jgi:PDZ domain